MAEESFVMVSLKDEKSKKLAEVISNKTSRKILDALSKKEYSESELAKELGIAISTIHYNLKHLMKAKLVTVDEFHYSEKGKEVNHYKLANKYVIITPSETPPSFMENLKKIIPVTIVVAAGAVLLKAFNFLNFGSTKMLSAPIESKAAPLTERVATAGALEDADVMVAEAAMDEGAVMAADAAPELAEEVTNEVIQETAQAIPEPITQSEPNLILWFIIGAVFTLIVYTIIEFIMHKWRRK